MTRAAREVEAIIGRNEETPKEAMINEFLSSSNFDR